MKNAFLTLLIFTCTFSAKASLSSSFVKYQVENGLSHNTVWCVLQDSYDFMWFGTSDGLNCFDGKNFRIFRYDSKLRKSIGNNFVRSLYEDDQRNIWIGTNKGLYLFDRKTESFSPFNKRTEDGVLISSNVNKILKSNNGDIWIATLGQGIFIYKPGTQVLVQNSQYTSFVWNLLKVPNGNIFATSRQDGLICFNKNGHYIRSYIPQNHNNELSDVEINALCYQNNALWFGVGVEGFYKLDLKSGQIRQVSNSKTSPIVSNIRSIFPFSNNELWVGGDNGLYTFNLSTEKFSRIDNPSNPKSLSDQSVYDIVRDREGGIWVSTYFGGVNYLPKDSKPFEHYFPLYQAGSISGKAVSQFCEDKTGNIWIATEDGGLNYFNARTHKTENSRSSKDKNGIGSHNIHSLLIDQNKLWIGTFSRGIDILDLNSRAVQNFQHGRFDSKSICDNAIYALYRDSHNDIYVGTAWGLSKYNRTSNDFTFIQDIGATTHVFDILEDSHGYLWIATYNSGVFRLNPKTKKWSHYIHIAGDAKTLPGNSVISLFEDNRQIVWLGTEGSGLCSFDMVSETFKPFDPENILLPNAVIYAIEQDEYDNFWIASNSGLLRINPYTKNNKRVFTKADGLQSNQFNFRSSLHASDGKLYFGGINGFNAFYPKNFTDNKFIPKVRITEFRLFNKKMNMIDEGSPLTAPIYDLKKLKLHHDQNTFSFSFVALSYQAPDKNQYSYMMEGVDKNWNTVEDGNNTVYFTNLSPGSYTFRVRGSNNDGVWSKDEAVIHIRISPPFLRSGLAYLIYLILLIYLTLKIFRLWRNRLSREHNQRLKEYHVEQEKEIYQSKINFFTNLAHEIRTPLTLIKLPLERIISSGEGNADTKGFLATIDKNADYLLNLINQLLDFRKTEEVDFQLHFHNTNVSELLRDLNDRFQHSAQIMNINLEMIIPEKDLITVVDPDAFIKMVSNLLSNALKYANAMVKLILVVNDIDFKVIITDDGKGIEEAERTKIFEAFYMSKHSVTGTGIGLAFARTLAEKHNGSLEFVNEEAGGSSFVISIPNKKGEFNQSTKTQEEVIEIDPIFNDLPRDTDQKEKNNNTVLNLLLVEDNTDLLHLTANYMRDFYQVHLATNGKEALTILEDENIDIVVSDVMMPEMDGYQLCQAIKSSAQYCHIPVILLTAKTTIESKIVGLESGTDAYLEKPFSLEHLRTQINNLFNSRQQLRETFASSPLMPTTEFAIAKKDRDFVERLNSAIEVHLPDSSFSIDTLSEILNMSRSNFYRKIKGLFGMSPNDYLKMLRLKKAAELLLKHEYRINEVYEQVGFSSSSYFAKCFKEQFAVLPREFVINAANSDSRKNDNNK